AFFPFAMTRADILRESHGGQVIKMGHAESSVSSGSNWDPFGGARPVAWWKLDEMSGSAAADYASSSLDGTWSGSGSATWHANGKIGYAGRFNGTDDYVDVADNNDLDATAVTIEAWVKSDTAGRYIVAKDPPGLLNSKSETLNSKQNPNDKFQITNPATSLRDNGAGKSQITNSPPEADHPWAGNNQNIFKQKFDFAKQKIVDFVKNSGRKMLARFWGKEAPQSPAAGDCGEAEDNKNPLLPVPLFAGGGVGGGFDGADGVDALIKSSRENDSVVSKNGFTKEYKAENKSLKIYGENTSIEMELLSPYTNKVSAGEAVLIAEMRLKDWQGKDNLFDELDFYDRKDYQKLEKQFTYKYAEE
ncbi:LamG domain-containing protein, partial [Candidatus Parcubacteria bacterium]|nr:LamG domain-containing protein [Candidatus Parcubacteria bacterium]